MNRGDNGFSNVADPLIKARIYMKNAGNSATANWGKIPYDTPIFDSHQIFNATGKYFAPCRSGYYQITCCAQIASTTTNVLGIGIVGNSAVYRISPEVVSLANSGSGLVYCDGENTKIFIWLYTSVSKAFSIDQNQNWCSILGPF